MMLEGVIENLSKETWIAAERRPTPYIYIPRWFAHTIAQISIMYGLIMRSHVGNNRSRITASKEGPC